MGTLKVNGNIEATGTISASSFLGNTTSATKLQTARTIQTNLASTSAASFDGTANITPGITGILPITNGGTGANNRKIAITNLGVFGLYSREDIGTSPNFDNPGINGLFEMREKTETPGETGTKPFNGYAPFISLRYSNTMFQLTGINGSGFYIRGIQAANPTLTGISWQKLLTNDNYTDYTVTKTGGGASGTWGINISGNATSATYVKDSYNSSNITITYGKAGQSSTSWLASWNGYELGAIQPSKITAGWASGASYSNSSNALASTGWGNGNFTYLQTSSDFYGNSGWSHYLISNHGDGSSYYNFVIALPFWSFPKYKRMQGGTAGSWYNFHTTENVIIQSSTPGAGFQGQIWLKI